MPLETPARIVRELTSRGYNADREAVTLLASASDPSGALERAVERAPEDALKLSVDHVRSVLDSSVAGDGNPSVSTGTAVAEPRANGGAAPVETKGSASTPRSPHQPTIDGDITGESTGTGEYDDFVAVFRDRFQRLSGKLRGRVNARPTNAVAEMPGGSDAAIVGMISDIRSTANGHWLVELEDTNGTFPCLVMKDKEFAGLVDELLLDETVAVEGSLSSDAGILFVDSLHFPDVPRTYQPSTADRHVQAALISDVHVGSQEFEIDAWQRFTSWLHTDEAQHVEYLLVAGDMVEGVGIYPNQDEELDIVDIFDQYEQFSEHLKEVPDDMEIVMIPGNHDAVRLAEPQPGFDDELREIMDVHDARITGNPSTVTIEGVSVLMYHGVSLDEVIAELPAEKASYDEPHKAMYQLLKKRHVAPQYGGHTRVAPEERDYLVIDEVPDIFHTGHVHKLGFGKYHNVLAINSGCWQSQTDFQKSVNIDPDWGYAPIVDLDTLDVTARKFV
ncbi:DNA-directed DNA polymerase II small subunit [Haladaptatus salinisoli]|uniref:DNA-directed DNA polymerase II small subunit n=1 Tax=Haladaptatus salinisoli TaxID=2884876 RepID=UPI001D0A615C|nr:DNA-directed DNA polymerase II small subunit [Haladaptatus salinisoli]